MRAPLVLILDEPTASLDAPTEQALLEHFALAAQHYAAAAGTVTLLVNHRFSTVRMADLIVLVADGAVAELGSHDKLLAAAGMYARSCTTCKHAPTPEMPGFYDAGALTTHRPNRRT